MPSERTLRLATFVEGTTVALADGQAWSLPRPRSDQSDPEYDAILRMIAEAEDEAERLRSELALTIFLLSRNYDLTPDGYQALLSFEPGDPALARLQEDVHALAVEQMRSGPWGRSAPEVEAPDALFPAWNVLARLRARWSLRHN